MLKPIYACVTSHASDGETASVKLCRGTKKAYAVLEEWAADDRVNADEDEDESILPTEKDFKQVLSRSGKFLQSGQRFNISIMRTYFC